jgi:hypothetical protein
MNGVVGDGKKPLELTTRRALEYDVDMIILGLGDHL